MVISVSFSDYRTILSKKDFHVCISGSPLLPSIVWLRRLSYVCYIFVFISLLAHMTSTTIDHRRLPRDLLLFQIHCHCFCLPCRKRPYSIFFHLHYRAESEFHCTEHVLLNWLSLEKKCSPNSTRVTQRTQLRTSDILHECLESLFSSNNLQCTRGTAFFRDTGFSSVSPGSQRSLQRKHLLHIVPFHLSVGFNRKRFEQHNARWLQNLHQDKMKSNGLHVSWLTRWRALAEGDSFLICGTPTATTPTVLSFPLHSTYPNCRRYHHCCFHLSDCYICDCAHWCGKSHHLGQ